MGAMGGPLGLKGGAAGSGFDAPMGADIQQAVSPTDAITAYNQNTANQQQQQSLLNALAGQGGIQNQSNVFNQMQGVANGQGPNPAQAMLNQQTGQNVQNQAALMAGQRGAGQNVGLLARQAAMQGANTQQQAVGQGATMQANQSLNALGQMGGMANNMVNNQIGQTNAITAANQAEQGNLLNALQGANQSRVGMQSNINQGNTALALQEMQQGESAVGGFLGGMGNAMPMMMGAHGGQVAQPMAEGGSAFGGGPSSEFGQFVSGVQTGSMGSTGSYVSPNSVMQPGGGKGGGDSKKPKGESPQAANSMPASGTTQGVDGEMPTQSFDQEGSSMMAAHGGSVDVVLSPEEKVVYPNKVKEAAGGRVEAKKVPGKAKYPGDTLKNDTYKTKLPEGSIVIPRTKAKDNKDSAAFVRKTLAKRRGK